MTVLITAASHAEAYRLERLLQSTHVVFADYHHLPNFSFSSRQFINIPKGDSNTYAHEVLKVCLDLEIDKIYPLYSDEILALAGSQQLFNEYGIEVIIPSLNWLKRNPFKKTTYSKNLVILEKGNITVGDLPKNATLPELLATGIFTWDMHHNTVIYNLYTVTHANLR